MSGEQQIFEKKSLKKIIGKTADFNEIAQECVGMANARGGHIFIGIEDKDNLPPVSQKIDDSLLETLLKRIPQITHNVIIAPNKITANNGGEYIDLEVFPTQNFACMSDGRYFLRVSDENNPLMPDELSRLMSDKAAFAWEIQTSQKVPHNRRDEAKVRHFLEMIRASDRVSDFVKSKRMKRF